MSPAPALMAASLGSPHDNAPWFNDMPGWAGGGTGAKAITPNGFKSSDLCDTGSG